MIKLTANGPGVAPQSLLEAKLGRHDLSEGEPGGKWATDALRILIAAVVLLDFCGPVCASPPESILIPLLPLTSRELSDQSRGTGSSGMSGLELKIWNDPSFKRRFAESYIAETEVEPCVTTSEREQMLKVLSLISDDKMDQAVRLLGKRRGEAASAVFDFTLANIHFQREQFDQAVEAYRVSVDKYPKFLRAWRNLGLIHIRQN